MKSHSIINMEQVLPYQSPIILTEHDATSIRQCISVSGKNINATYNKDAKIFEVRDKIILRVNSRLYQLDEYHFHTPGEHNVNDKIYPSEIHYVFIEIESGKKHLSESHKCSNICGGFSSKNENVLAIGRLIKGLCQPDITTDLSKVQVQLPNSYYEYDGSLTTGSFAPVRWIVGDQPIQLNINEIVPFSKDARPLQPIDGRIILYAFD